MTDDLNWRVQERLTVLRNTSKETPDVGDVVYALLGEEYVSAISPAILARLVDSWRERWVAHQPAVGELDQAPYVCSGHDRWDGVPWPCEVNQEVIREMGIRP